MFIFVDATFNENQFYFSKPNSSLQGEKPREEQEWIVLDNLKSLQPIPPSHEPSSYKSKRDTNN